MQLHSTVSSPTKKDVICAVLSDTNQIYNSIRDINGYYHYFSKNFLSFETGFLKPDPRAYLQVIDYYKLSPEEIFFIDDQLRNVEAAQQLGIQAVVFKSTAQLTQELLKRDILSRNAGS